MPRKKPEQPKRQAAAVQLRELPTISTFTPQFVNQVRSALNSLMQGSTFQPAADLLDAVWADARVASALTSRTNGIFGAPLELGGKTDSAKVLAVGEELKQDWPEMLPKEERNQLFTWGIGLGIGVARLTWDKSGPLWRPRLKTWHARNLNWDWQKELYRISTMTGMVEIAPGDREWVVFTPYGYKRGWAQALVRRLAIPWLVRTWALRDWARHSELHGIPTRKAKVPSDADKERKDDFLRAVVNLANEPCILLERDANGETGYDLEFLEAASESYEVFQQLLAQCDSDIAIAVKGENLTTEVKGGSYAAAQVHDDVRTDYKKDDSDTFGECLFKQVLRPYALLNHGSEELAPRPKWQVEPPEDLGAKSLTLSQLGDALTKLKQVSYRVDVDASLEEFGIPLLSEAEAAKAKAQAEEDAAKEAQLQQPKLGAGEEVSALSRLAGPDLRWQTYIDALADHAKLEAATLLSGDLQKLRGVLARVKDSPNAYEEVRGHLLRTYEGMDPENLALLTQKVLLLGKLAGRAAVLEEL